MIVVKIELWPAGDASAAQPLGILAVARQPQEPVPYLDPNEQRYAAPDRDQFPYKLEFTRFDTGTKTRGRVFHHRRRGWVVLVRDAVMELFHGS